MWCDSVRRVVDCKARCRSGGMPQLCARKALGQNCSKWTSLVRPFFVNFVTLLYTILAAIASHFSHHYCGLVFFNIYNLSCFWILFKLHILSSLFSPLQFLCFSKIVLFYQVNGYSINITFFCFFLFNFMNSRSQSCGILMCLVCSL